MATLLAYENLATSCFSFPMASPTRSSIPTDISILKRIWMTLRAMSFTAIHRCNSYTSQNIFTSTNHFHMSRINTSPVSTEMINRHIGGNFTPQQFIGKTVSENTFTMSRAKLPITIAMSTSQPFPTIFSSRFINHIPKSLLNGKGKISTSNFISHNNNCIINNQKCQQEVYLGN